MMHADTSLRTLLEGMVMKDVPSNNDLQEVYIAEFLGGENRSFFFWYPLLTIFLPSGMGKKLGQIIREE